MDHFAVAMDLAEKVKAQGAEIERLKDLVREQDRARGTVTVRAELADKVVIQGGAPGGESVMTSESQSLRAAMSVSPPGSRGEVSPDAALACRRLVNARGESEAAAVCQIGVTTLVRICAALPVQRATVTAASTLARAALAEEGVSR